MNCITLVGIRTLHVLGFYCLVFSSLFLGDDLCINHTTKNVIGIETRDVNSGKNSLDTKLTPKITKTNTTASFTVRAFLRILEIITAIYKIRMNNQLYGIGMNKEIAILTKGRITPMINTSIYHLFPNIRASKD